VVNVAGGGKIIIVRAKSTALTRRMARPRLAAAEGKEKHRLTFPPPRQRITRMTPQMRPFLPMPLTLLLVMAADSMLRRASWRKLEASGFTARLIAGA
jgi:hypothetical protein